MFSDNILNFWVEGNAKVHFLKRSRDQFALMYLELLAAARPDSSLRETQRELGPPYLEDNRAPHIVPTSRQHSLVQSSPCPVHRIHAG